MSFRDAVVAAHTDDEDRPDVLDQIDIHIRLEQTPETDSFTDLLEPFHDAIDQTDEVVEVRILSRYAGQLVYERADE